MTIVSTFGRRVMLRYVIVTTCDSMSFFQITFPAKPFPFKLLIFQTRRWTLAHSPCLSVRHTLKKCVLRSVLSSCFILFFIFFFTFIFFKSWVRKTINYVIHLLLLFRNLILLITVRDENIVEVAMRCLKKYLLNKN